MVPEERRLSCQYIHTHRRAHIQKHAHTQMYIHIHKHAHTQMCTHIHKHAHIYTVVHTHLIIFWATFLAVFHLIQPTGAILDVSLDIESCMKGSRTCSHQVQWATDTGRLLGRSRQCCAHKPLKTRGRAHTQDQGWSGQGKW